MFRATMSDKENGLHCLNFVLGELNDIMVWKKKGYVYFMRREILLFYGGIGFS